MALKAHLDHNALPADSQRSAPRRGLWLETSGFFAGAGEANVTIHNISATGLLLETGLVLEEGEQLALDLPEAGAVIASVVWRSERLYGCAFARPLGQAALAAVQLQGFAAGVPGMPERLAAAGAQGGGITDDSLGTRLNRLRREAGLTLSDVAATLGVSKPTVWAWEKGKARPLPERLAAIAAALGVTPELLASRPAQREIDTMLEDCRTRIAEAYGTTPEAVRIMVEL